jgi:hypothetical protein
MTTTEKEAIATPATGLLVYDTDFNTFYYWDGTAWVAVGAGSSEFWRIHDVSGDTFVKTANDASTPSGAITAQLGNLGANFVDQIIFQADNSSSFLFGVSAAPDTVQAGGILFLYSGDGTTYSGNVFLGTGIGTIGSGNIFLTTEDNSDKATENNYGTINLTTGDLVIVENTPGDDPPFGLPRWYCRDGLFQLEWNGSTAWETDINNAGGQILTPPGSVPDTWTFTNYGSDYPSDSAWDGTGCMTFSGISVCIDRCPPNPTATAPGIFLTTGSSTGLYGFGGKIVLQTGSGSQDNDSAPSEYATFRGGDIELRTGNATSLPQGFPDGCGAGNIILLPGQGISGDGSFPAGNSFVHGGKGPAAGSAFVIGGEGNGSGAGDSYIQGGPSKEQEGDTPGHVYILGGDYFFEEPEQTLYQGGHVYVRGGGGQYLDPNPNAPVTGGNVWIAGGQGSTNLGKIIVGQDGSNTIFSLLFQSDNTNLCGFKAPSGGINQTWSLPATSGAEGEYLARGSGDTTVWAPQPTYTLCFDDTDLSSGILSVTHNLDFYPVLIQIYDNNGLMCMPDQIQLTGDDTASIDFSTYGTLEGTWCLIVKR